MAHSFTDIRLQFLVVNPSTIFGLEVEKPVDFSFANAELDPEYYFDGGPIWEKYIAVPTPEEPYLILSDRRIVFQMCNFTDNMFVDVIFNNVLLGGDGMVEMSFYTYSDAVQVHNDIYVIDDKPNVLTFRIMGRFMVWNANIRSEYEMRGTYQQIKHSYNNRIRDRGVKYVARCFYLSFDQCES